MSVLKSILQTLQGMHCIDPLVLLNPFYTSPDAYVIPSAINNHKGASSQSTSLRKLKNIASFGLTKRPIPIDSQSIEGIMHDHTIQQESTVSMIPTTPILTENDLPAGEIRNSFLGIYLFIILLLLTNALLRKRYAFKS